LVEATYRLMKTVWVNNTAVYFETETGETINIVNGEAWLEEADGERQTLCEASVKCAALKVSCICRMLPC
jgi:hypothetical protein